MAGSKKALQRRWHFILRTVSHHKPSAAAGTTLGTMLQLEKIATWPAFHLRPRPVAIALFMSTLILLFGFYILYPLFLIFVNSFNAADIGDPFTFTLGHWRTAYADPQIFQALKNTFYIYFLYTGISFPLAVIIAWVL
ncbi:MAG: hypothetical protein GTO40_03850, partial [Deltaproteobacteria bacterium]|nr:hypothetical protein [Deltaproteobacteria bacterium]